MSVLRILLVFLIAHAAAATPCQEVVCVEVERTPAAVTFHAVSRADGVTVFFSVVGQNIEPASPSTVTKTLRRGRTELLTLKTVAGKEPTFEHAFFWEWGIVGATHDDNVSYRLPFARGEFRLWQGPDGRTSHQGQFAYDFSMPRGTPVCAARAGSVADVIDGFDEGGPHEQFREKANVVRIVHDDGTIADYVHLMRGTMRVRVGDRVVAGTVLGMSGNSGWSEGPHLHFQVWRRMPSAPNETLPVKFLVDGKPGVVLEERKSYSPD